MAATETFTPAVEVPGSYPPRLNTAVHQTFCALEPLLTVKVRESVRTLAATPYPTLMVP